jgi:uncharacterized protein YdaU (DUF1376 family)
VNFYKHHIGDYDADTAHLSIIEDGVYTRLLRLYYRSEQPIPADTKQACRLIRAASKQERDAVVSILNEFFTLESDGWHNKRCDEELTAYVKQSETNRAIAVARERKRKGNESLHESFSSREPSQKPEARSHKPEPEKATALTPVDKQEGGAIAIATALRSEGVNCNAMHPSVIALADQGVTTKTALEAVRIAKQDRGKDRPSIGYLMPIINDLQTQGGNWPHAKPSGTAQAIAALEAMK